MSFRKLIELPKKEIDPEKTKNLCKCRPICKGRRRERKGQIQKTSAELLVERKPTPECRRRRPSEFKYESICPLLGHNREVNIKKTHPPPVIRLCAAPIDTVVDTTYLQAVDLANKLGVTVPPSRLPCPMCNCCRCCPCSSREYDAKELERDTLRRRDMRAFDARLKQQGNVNDMKIMYDLGRPWK